MTKSALTRRAFLAGAAGALAASAPVYRVAAAQENTPQWEPLVVDGSGPPPRWDHLLAADEAGEQLILFGGRDGAGASFNDTWRFDLATGAWTQLDTSGPAPRFGVAGGVDAVNRRLYLFGGEDGATFYNDAWRFDLDARSWRQLDDGSGIAPSPRYGLGGVVDPSGNLIISHGFTFEGRFDDTWAFDPRERAWADISPAPETRPLRRCLQEQVWDTQSNRMLLYGGCSSGYGPCPQGDLWSFDPTADRWANITPAAGPAPRSNPAMVWDPLQEQAVLFGGLTEAGYAADLWAGRFDGDAFVWTEQTAGGLGPAPRASHDAVQVGNAIYLFGGTSAEGTYNDLWRLSL